jgi:hypothetical protein
VRNHSSLAFVLALVLLTHSQLSCQNASHSSGIADSSPDLRMTDQQLLKQIEAFASSDPAASSNAWKILHTQDQRVLIKDLERLSSTTPQDDFHRVLISFLLCYLDHEYEKNRSVVVSAIQEGRPFKGSNGDWGASLARRLMVKGDPSLLTDLLRAAKWSDGAMSAELAYAYSEALIKDPNVFLRELQNEDEKVRERVLRLLADNTLSAEDMMKVKSFLSSQCRDSSTRRLACETLSALSKE